MTPYAAFIDWIGALPAKYQRDLVMEIAAGLPGIDVNPFHRAFFSQFTAQLDAVAKKGAAAERGLVVCLKALVEDSVNRHLKASSSADWQKEKADLAEMAALTGSCSLAEHAAARTQHDAQWQMVASEWQTLASGALGDAAVDACYALNVN